MNTLLIFPPISDPVHPPLGIAKLAGYLRNNNKVVKLIDLNIESYYYFFNKEHLKYYFNNISNRLHELGLKNSLNAQEMQEYKRLSISYLDGQYLIEMAEKSLDDLRSPETYMDWVKYSNAASIINRTMKLVADSHYPTIWNARNLVFSSSQTASADILKVIYDQKENLFIPFFKNYTSEFKKFIPGLIGISINYFCQLVPGLTLAALLKEEIKEVKIILGGSFFASYRDRWQVLAPFREIADIIIPFAGEVPLLNTIEALETNHSLDDVPGIINCANEAFTYYEINENISNIENNLPDFSDFTFSKYLSPYPMLPYSSTRGCYWGKCTFCSQHLLYQNAAFKKKSTDKIVDELMILSKRYGINEFYFVDEAIPVKMALDMSEDLMNREPEIHWFGDMRLEAGIDANLISKLETGGCRMLIMGLESSVERITGLMKKGTSSDTVSSILKNCSHSTIKTFVMFFIGFPTETEEEALKTVQFVEEHKDGIHYISFDRFVLLKNTPVYKNASNYSLTVQEYQEEKEDLAIHARYQVASGLSRKEAETLLEKIKKRPVISSYLKYDLISRSHLPYLPKIGIEEIKTEDTEMPLEYYPRKQLHVQLVELKYDISEKETSETKDTFYYCYNPYSQTLIEIGKYGKALVESCDGSRSLEEIFDFFGSKNKKEIQDFYKRLYKEGMI